MPANIGEEWNLFTERITIKRSRFVRPEGHSALAGQQKIVLIPATNCQVSESFYF